MPMRVCVCSRGDHPSVAHGVPEPGGGDAAAGVRRYPPVRYTPQHKLTTSDFLSPPLNPPLSFLEEPPAPHPPPKLTATKTRPPPPLPLHIFDIVVVCRYNLFSLCSFYIYIYILYVYARMWNAWVRACHDRNFHFADSRAKIANVCFNRVFGGGFFRVRKRVFRFFDGRLTIFGRAFGSL